MNVENQLATVLISGIIFKAKDKQRIRDKPVQKHNTVIDINGFHSFEHHRDNPNLYF